MTATWTPKETNTHQDHVIAHVLGTTILGYFVFDEALYLLLNIGFVWTIFLDGEMSLLPHPVAIGELELDNAAKDEFKADIDRLLQTGASREDLSRMRAIDGEFEISDVGFFEQENRRRLVLTSEERQIAIETSLETAEITLYE